MFSAFRCLACSQPVGVRHSAVEWGVTDVTLSHLAAVRVGAGVSVAGNDLHRYLLRVDPLRREGLAHRRRVSSCQGGVERACWRLLAEDKPPVIDDGVQDAKVL
jgi:hypothetical protein